MVINEKVSKINIFCCFLGYIFSLKFAGTVFVGTVLAVSIILSHLITESSIILAE